MSRHQGNSYSRGEISMSTEEKELNKEWIVPVSNPQSLKIKVPVRLHEKILACEEPVVGLDFIDELLPESDAEMEPQYTCRLCGSTGPANGMFTHLMGGTHRHAFLEEMGESFHKRDTKAMMNRVKRYAENKMRLADKIQTVHCDASYPWPAGKAPWSLEMGGTGIPPQAKHPLPSSRVRAASVTSTPEPATLLPAPGTFQKPRNAEEARRNAEEARRNAEEARRNLEEAQSNVEEARRNAEEARRNDEEAQSNVEEAQKILVEVEHMMRKVEDIAKKWQW